jgi:hypothetical protein
MQARYDPSIFHVPFASLPDQKRVWIGEPGSKLEGLGKLSLLTPELVARTVRDEVQTGRRVGLGWSMQKLEFSQFGRAPCGHKILALGEDVVFRWDTEGGGWNGCFDDEFTFNPRASWLFFFFCFFFLLLWRVCGLWPWLFYHFFF